MKQLRYVTGLLTCDNEREFDIIIDLAGGQSSGVTVWRSAGLAVCWSGGVTFWWCGDVVVW